MTGWAVHTLLAVSVLLGVVLLARRAVARRFGARAAYALWLLPVLRVPMPGLSLPRAWWPAPSIPPPLTPRADFAPAGTDPVVAAPIMPEFSFALTVLVLWGLVAVVLLATLWRRQRRFTRALITRSRPANDSLMAVLADVCARAGLRQPPVLRIGNTQTGPLVTGLWHPVILLPNATVDALTPEQLRLALLHEVLHVRRGDLWIATATAILRAVIWWHPLVHLAWPRFRSDQEAACDAHLLRVEGESARVPYAETLLRAAHMSGAAQGSHRSDTKGAALALLLHHSVRERLMNLSQHPTRKGRTVCGAALLCAVLASAPLGLADPPQTSGANQADETTSNSTVRLRTNGSGYDITERNGVRRFMRVERDGTTQSITEDEFREAAGVSFAELVTPQTPPQTPPRILAVPSEPGLSPPMPPRVSGVPALMEFRVETDGTATAITTPPGVSAIRMRLSPEQVQDMLDGGEAGTVGFVFSPAEPEAMASAQSRLQSAQATLSAVEATLEALDADLGRDAQRAIRDAERDLAEARAFLETAQERAAQ